MNVVINTDPWDPVLVPGHRVVDELLFDAHGDPHTMSFVVLREVTFEDYLKSVEHHGGDVEAAKLRSYCRYYEVAID